MIKSYIRSELSSLTSRTLTSIKCSLIKLIFSPLRRSKSTVDALLVVVVVARLIIVVV